MMQSNTQGGQLARENICSGKNDAGPENKRTQDSVVCIQ